MKEYYRKDITLSIDFSEYNEILIKEFKTNLSTLTYNSKLIYNQRKPEYLQLIIYYPQSDFLFEKFEILRDNKICIFRTFKKILKINKRNLSDNIIDFSKSNLINIEIGHYWEHNKKPVILTIDNLDILDNGGYYGDGIFQLTENVFQHLDEYIKYSDFGIFQSNNKFIEKNTNRKSNFGVVDFIISIEHWIENYNKFNLNISRDAYLIIFDKTKNLSDKELIRLGNSLCLLMSFYWQKHIDFFYAQVRINNNNEFRNREIFKYSNHFVDVTQKSILKQKFNTYYDFIDTINFDKFNKYFNLINELVPRIIKTKNVDDISAFMILYNIIEKIRNHCLNNPVNDKVLLIREEFNFIKGKNATNKFIKNKIKEIQVIVEETDIEEFISKASDKVSFIKKTGLIDQFDSLLVYLDLKPENYDINFKNLIKIRNNIYHGKIPTEDVIPYNEQMLILVYDMIIKLMTD